MSKVGVMDLCPKQYLLKYVTKEKERQKSGASKVGVALHAILEYMLKDPALNIDSICNIVCEKELITASERIEIEARLGEITEFVARMVKYKISVGATRELIEFKTAMRNNFAGADFFDKGVLIRGVIDYALITQDGWMIIIDHKSGRKKPIEEHNTQFYCYMLMAIANFPEIKGVQCAINYIGSPKLDWALRPDGAAPGAWTRAEIQARLYPWMQHYLNSLAIKLTALEDGVARAETGWQCGYCGYVDTCEAGQAEIAKRNAKRGKLPAAPTDV